MLGVILLLLAIAVPQAAPIARGWPDVSVVKFGWRKLPKNVFPSGEKLKEMRDAAIDARIREEYRDPHPNYAAISALEEQKRNQMTPLDVPVASDKAYEYKFKFKNTGSKQVTRLRWVYSFKDAATGRELVRLRFEGAVKIDPGREKRVVAYADSSPPLLVSAKAEEKTGKAWKEEVTVEEVGYADGSSSGNR